MKKKNGKVSKAVKTYVKKTLKSEIEIKQIQLAFPASAGLAANQATGATYFTPAIAQGVNINQRIGNKVRICKIDVKGYLVNGTATADRNARIIIWRDLRPDGAVTTPTSVLVDAGSATSVNSGYNVDFVDRVKILYDKSFMLNNGGGATDQAGAVKWSFMKKYSVTSGPILQYSGTTGGITECESGQLFIMVVTSATTSQPFVYMTCNINYLDV